MAAWTKVRPATLHVRSRRLRLATNSGPDCFEIANHSHTLLTGPFPTYGVPFPDLRSPTNKPTAELKKLERISKFNKIRDEGGEAKVKEYIAKRRKRNAQKDHRYVPYERR